MESLIPVPDVVNRPRVLEVLDPVLDSSSVGRPTQEDERGQQSESEDKELLAESRQLPDQCDGYNRARYGPQKEADPPVAFYDRCRSRGLESEVFSC